eukprot:m.62822 g.62822  ORF g.62822 m.62822 type:complete len:89 (-) comp15815_c0_seq4:3283-3549(-)
MCLSVTDVERYGIYFCEKLSGFLGKPCLAPLTARLLCSIHAAHSQPGGVEDAVVVVEASKGPRPSAARRTVKPEMQRYVPKRRTGVPQ